MKRYLLAISVLSLVALLGCARQNTLKGQDASSSIKVDSRGVKYIVDPGKILSGGPPKDGIPSIDNPKFVKLAEADRWIKDNELVLAIIYKGVKRVYPLQILVWHEIVNDAIAGDPILITYCPLCGSGIAYLRSIDGEAIVGELTGRGLTEISIDTVTWGEWKREHPESEVLSRDTGFSRSYGRDPYGSYYKHSTLMFPVEHDDRRIHPKTVIFGIEVGGVYKAYKEEDVMKKGTFEDSVAGVAIRVNRDPAGIVSFTNMDSGKEIVKERDFWFAWYAFHPDTLVYEDEHGTREKMYKIKFDNDFNVAYVGAHPERVRRLVPEQIGAFLFLEVESYVSR